MTENGGPCHHATFTAVFQCPVKVWTPNNLAYNQKSYFNTGIPRYTGKHIPGGICCMQRLHPHALLIGCEGVDGSGVDCAGLVSFEGPALHDDDNPAVPGFQVDGKTNAKIQTIHLEKFPVNKAAFSADGEQIVATGWRNKLFYIYDMMEGRVIPVSNVRGLNEQKVSDFQVSPDGKFLLLFGSSGFLHLMSSKTREVVRSMKLNGTVCATAFTADGSQIFANSEEGEVFIWDVQSSKCVKRFEDDGCVRGTSLALSRDGSYLACGSQAGVVNIYSQRDCLLEHEPKPLKAVLNLLTPATSLRFNSSAEILAIGSRHADEANRLVHLPSFTVFSNFPKFQKKMIFQTQSVDFSPRSGFYSVANNKGHALLFRLLHYHDF
ncbi:U3 small nucleolar RNA-associated protein 18 homolog [Pimephales promelas]|uniref:U3 small nucleolar RNA-associated protein 18 homolog n=1 Tax=Pimephales promelas TaxID=90988 RepID=UPI001955D8E3|nr:U3 small nucleolar RNA-associated protein 18 homolog [Pimephales promelas]